MSATSRLLWFFSALRLQGSILPRILPRIALFCTVALVAVVTYKRELWTNSENLQALTGNVACNLVLGLLLVFRTNTAYERFWEGRKAWGTLVITTRNLAREIQIAIEAPTDEARAEKDRALKRLVSFAIAVKAQLRQTSPIGELSQILSAEDIEQIAKASRPPQLITFWLSYYLKQQEKNGYVDRHQRLEINRQINLLVEGLSGCERIIKTPMPASYGIYLKRLTLLYCLLLPLGLAAQLGWITIGAIALVSYVLLGVEEIGNEIENPFGYDFNDLKLDSICETLLKDINSTLAFTEGRLMDEKTEETEVSLVEAA